MRCYPEYKESGVEFIGEIPKAWHLTKLKYVAQIDNSGLWGEEQGMLDIDAPVSTTAHLTRGGDWLIKQMPIRSFSKGDYEYYSGKNGDIIIVKSSGSATNIITGKAGFIDNLSKGIVFSNFLMRVKPNREKYEPKLLYYFLTSSITIERIKRMVSTTTYPNLKVEEYISNLIPIPPSKDEQVKIANFLNRKTGQIDELLRIKQRRIELLQEQRTALINQAVTKGLDPNVEMKPSGVEWIGEIPKHWEMKRIKYLASLISKGTTPTTIGREILYEGEIRFIKAENIVDNQIELKPEYYIDEETNQMLKRSQLRENDLLFVIAGATIGKASFVRPNHLPANTNQAISFIRPYQKELPEFIYYWLQSDNIQKIIWMEAVQSAQPNLSMEDLGNLYIPYPSIAEQHCIVDYIADKTQTIVQLLQRAYKQIELLKEYRQSLISEAVTGKIDVRNEV